MTDRTDSAAVLQRPLVQRSEDRRGIAKKFRLNLGFRRKARQLGVVAADLMGVTVITTETRNKILRSEPWLAPYFSVEEKTKAPKESEASGSHHYLRFNNPRLQELRARYQGHPAANHVQWGAREVESRVDLSQFRADNLYVYQSRRYSPIVFYATAAYVKIADRLGLLDRLEEEGAFGAEVFDFHGKAISRDLLDSVLELNFLERYLSVSQKQGVRVCDIGAGYGRFAHRMLTALPNISRFYCIDAVPESTFLSEHYLRFRGLTEHAMVLPLDQLSELSPGSVDLAINIHSFSECRKSVVDWWLRWVCEKNIPHLFIVAASDLGLTTNEGRGKRGNFAQSLEEFGFKLAAREKKYEQVPMLQVSGLYPADYYLFQRS